MDQLSRRAVLRVLSISSLGLSAGCASIPSLGDNEPIDHDPGALVVENWDSLAHVMNVSVAVPKSVTSETVSRDVIAVIEQDRDGQISVDTDETKVYPEFLSGSVMYTVNMSLRSSDIEPTADADRERETIKFSPAAVDTPNASGSFLTIRIKQYGELSSHVTYVY